MAYKINSPHKKDRARVHFFREFVTLFRSLALDEPMFSAIYPTRNETAPDGSVMYFYFAGYCSEEEVEKILGTLILYKPSIRKAIGEQVRTRYVPQLVFKYDSSFEKVQRIEKLLSDIGSEKAEVVLNKENE